MFYSFIILIFLIYIHIEFCLQIIKLTDTLDELLKIAGEKLQIEAKIFYTVQGGEIDDIELIK